MDNKVKERREYYGLSQRKLAKLAEVSPSEIRNIESGKHFPRLDAAFRIAYELHSDVYEIWGWERKKK